MSLSIIRNLSHDGRPDNLFSPGSLTLPVSYVINPTGAYVHNILHGRVLNLKH